MPAFTGLGSPWWDPYARGTITGLTAGRGRAHIARAVRRGHGVPGARRGRRHDGRVGSPVGAAGRRRGRRDGPAAAAPGRPGAACPWRGPRTTETTALGAATVAGVAEGVWSSLDELAALWQAERTFEPELPADLADALHAGWRRAVEKSMGWAATEPA